MICSIRKMGNGPALVLIHGFGFNHTIWLDEIVSHCKSSYTCYLIDLPGSGDSQVDFYTLSDLVESLMPHLPNQFTLCGWSLGGLVGLQMALDYPDRIKQLCTLATDPGFAREGIGLDHLAMKQFHDSVMLNKDKAMRRFLHLQFSDGGFDKARYQSMLKIMQPFPSKETLSWGIQILSDTRLANRLNELTVPSVFFYGDEDKIVSPNTYLHMTSFDLPTVCTHLLKGAGHHILMTHHHRVVQHFEESI